ncbi:MAG: response regulator transcription factor [Actinobacteria bacterium]|nr:response regulator transcription factor [Actinomycetota bacterium]
MIGETRIRVIVADDHPVVRHGLRSMLELEPGIEVVGEARDGRELLSEMEDKKPDVVLVDLRMPGVGGIEAVRKALSSGTAARLVALTAYDEEEYMLEAIRAGVHGYLLKEIDADTLVNAIEAVFRGEMVLDERVGKKFQELASGHLPGNQYSEYGLTSREIEVLELMQEGLAGAELASRLFISVNTLKFHQKNIYAKLGVHGREEALRKLRFGCPPGAQRP